MATWEDGPEYAPHQRPDQFSAPEQVAPLSVAAPPAQPSRGAPAQPPSGFQTPQQVAPLGELVPPVRNPRDPHRAFEVASSAMTAQSSPGPAAWGAVHSSSWAPPGGEPVPGPPPSPGHDPRQPFTLQQGMRPGQAPVPAAAPPLPAPGTDQWFAPGSWAPPAPPADDRSLMRRVVDGATAPVLITLVIGLIPMLAPFCVVIALVLTRMVPRRRSHVRAGYLMGLGVMLLSALAGFVGTGSFGGAVSAMQGPAALVCLVMLIASPVISYLSIDAGEVEERPQGSTRGSSSWG